MSDEQLEIIIEKLSEINERLKPLDSISVGMGAIFDEIQHLMMDVSEIKDEITKNEEFNN